MATFANAQQYDDTAFIRNWLKQQIDSISDPGMYGRGYVNKGRDKAADYLSRQFKALNLKYPGKKRSYFQQYSFPVNTFPGKMNFAFDGKPLAAGEDFWIDAGSNGIFDTSMQVEVKDLASIATTEEWDVFAKSFQPKGRAYILLNADSLCKKLGIRKRYLTYILPKGCFILGQKGKFNWTVECDHAEATVLYVRDELLKNVPSKASANIASKWFSSAKSKNLIGVLPGAIADSYLVVSAHFDHLGMMGINTVFPGASDNASGTAMLLYLAKYFSTHPHKYSIIFIAFSGEEAGLLGSEYYIRHPKLPLNRIKFLTNIDIMGDATEGITVVNATEYPKQFDFLKEINSRNHYLPKIVSRGKASNSDHYYFSELGIPSIFIYTNGGKGYYHDIFDKKEEVTLMNIPQNARLLIDFLRDYQ